MDIFGICQRPAFSLSKMNISMKILIQLVIEVAQAQWKKKHPCCTIVCFQMPGFRLEVYKYTSEKLLAQKLRYFRGSCFSHCFILWTALHCLLPVFSLTIKLVVTRSVHAFKHVEKGPWRQELLFYMFYSQFYICHSKSNLEKRILPWQCLIYNYLCIDLF